MPYELRHVYLSGRTKEPMAQMLLSFPSPTEGWFLDESVYGCTDSRGPSELKHVSIEPKP